MQRIEIKGEQQTISKVFSERYAFEVPPYQRPYAWTTEHAGELLDDLLESMGEGAEPVNELRPYFPGSIVLVKGERPESQIVDGQQRLVTMTDSDTSDWIPPAISYMARHHQQPDRLVPFLTKLECLAASLMIRRQYRHRRVPRYAAVL